MCLREYLSGPRESNLLMNKKKKCKFKRHLEIVITALTDVPLALCSSFICPTPAPWQGCVVTVHAVADGTSMKGLEGLHRQWPGPG